jgi:hypothetical protein
VPQLRQRHRCQVSRGLGEQLFTRGYESTARSGGEAGD